MGVGGRYQIMDHGIVCGWRVEYLGQVEGARQPWAECRTIIAYAHMHFSVFNPWYAERAVCVLVPEGMS